MMDLVTIAMGKIEEKYEARLEKYKKQESHKRTFNLSRKLTSYFDDFDASMLNRHVGAVIQGIRVEDADKSDPENIFDDSTTNLTMHPISGDPFVTGIAPSPPAWSLKPLTHLPEGNFQATHQIHPSIQITT